MIKILKEMGRVCENKKISLLVQDFHRQKFNQLYKERPTEAERHQRDFMWWTKRVTEINKHIEQLHKKLNKVA